MRHDATIDDEATAKAAPRPLQPMPCVIGLTAALAVASAGIAVMTPGWSNFDAANLPILMALVAAFAASDRVMVHLEVRTQATSYSPSDIALAVGVVFVNPLGLIVARLAGAMIISATTRRGKAMKRLFNSANYAFESSVAFAVYRTLVDPAAPASLASWMALLLALFGALVLAGLAVTAAVSCFEGNFVERAIDSVRSTPLFHLPGATLGAAIATSMQVAPWLGIATAALIPVVWLVVRSHASLLHRYSDLTSVHQFSKEVGDSTDVGSIIATAGEQIAQNLRADSVAVRVWDRSRESTESVIGPMAVRALIPAPDTVIESGLAADDGGLSINVMLEDERGPFGVIRVGERLGTSVHFDEDDRARLASMAQQLAVAVRKSQLHAQIQFEATHDRLTGLANRSFFEAWVDEAAPTKQPATVLFADLDGFKEINDAFGHHAGDMLLKAVAERIADCTPAGGLAARFGGDEFAVFAPGLGLNDAEELAACVSDALDEPFVLPQASVAIASSVGISCTPDHGHTAMLLLRRADAAMYQAKRNSRRFSCYDRELDEDDSSRLALLADLRQALVDDELEVHYQPKIDIATGEVVAAEALVRWSHPDHGPIRPDVFVELAQQASLIEQLTDLVMGKAVGAAAQWQRRDWNISVAVNISARSLLDERLIEMVERHLGASGLDGSALTLEITESTMMGDPDRTHRMLHRLNELGVEIAVDDFGTGFSSLSSLRSLPVAELKIDRGFVSAMNSSHHDAVIVHSTIDLAHNLGLRIVAEGVETVDILGELGRLDCDLAQGYGISRPLPLLRFNEWIRQRLGAGVRPTWDSSVATLFATSDPNAKEAPPDQAESNSENTSSKATT